MPNHLDIRVSGGRIVIGSAVDFPGLIGIDGNEMLRREGLRELRRHPEVLAALRRWPQLGHVFAGSMVNTDTELFRRIENAVARRRAVVLFVGDMPPLALFDSHDEHGRFKSIAATPRPPTGQAKPASSPDDAVAAMTPRARVVLALTESRKYMLDALGDYMQELIVQGALPMLGFFLFALVAANVANPIIGGLMDGAIMAFVVITVGVQGIQGLQMLAGAIVNAATAKDRATIDASAKAFAEAIAAVGGTVFLGWLLRRVGKVAGGSKSAGGGGGAAAADEGAAASKYVDPRTQPSTKKILEPNLKSKPPATANSTSVGPKKRPTWRESELEVGKRIRDQGYEAQKSFKDGVEVPYGTKGSVRPEYFKSGSSIEVKNYNVETSAGRANLVRNVSKQAIDRVKNLPEGTVQNLVLDARGQNVSRSDLNSMLAKIVENSKGAIKSENIDVLR